jgi:hypothetical protein
MAQTVGSHSVATFTSPTNGDALDATIVKGNDNTLRSSYVDHDADPGIHVQSSALSARPAAGSIGRKWLTTDSGSVKLWFDDGSNWNEIDYVDSTELATALTTLNATYLTSGTVPDARFPATLPAVSGANLTNLPAGAAGTLTGTTLASNVVTSSLTSTGTLTTLTVAGATTIGGTTNLQDNILQRPVLKDYGETKTAPTISSGTLTLNLENGNVFDVALNANITTLTISNPPASGTAGSFTLNLTADGTARTVTWGSSVKWPYNTAPTLTSTNGKVDVFVFYTLTGGTTWFAFVAGQNL